MLLFSFGSVSPSFFYSIVAFGFIFVSHFILLCRNISFAPHKCAPPKIAFFAKFLSYTFMEMRVCARFLRWTDDDDDDDRSVDRLGVIHFFLLRNHKWIEYLLVQIREMTTASWFCLYRWNVPYVCMHVSICGACAYTQILRLLCIIKKWPLRKHSLTTKWATAHAYTRTTLSIWALTCVYITQQATPITINYCIITQRMRVWSSKWSNSVRWNSNFRGIFNAFDLVLRP